MSVSGAVHLQELFPQVETQEVKGWMSTYGRTRRKEDHNKHGFNLTLFLCQILINLKWNWQLPFPRTDRDLTKPIPTPLLFHQRSYFCWFANYRQVSFPKVNYHIWGVQLQDSAKKRKIWISLSKVSTFTCERVCSLLTVMCKYRVWLGCKMGNWKK